MNRYLDERTKAQRDLDEWRRYLAAGIKGPRVRKVRKDEVPEVLRLPNDTIPLIHWSGL